MKPLHLLSLFLSGCWITACSPSDLLDMNKETVRFSGNILRAEENGKNSLISDGTTVRFFLYQPGTLRDRGTGTYVYHQDKTYLVAADIDNNNGTNTPNPNAGINGKTEMHSLAAISPALTVKQVGERWALITCPNKQDDAGKDAGAVYATKELETFDLGEYADISFTQPLKDIRSKIGFEISTSLKEQLSNITLKVIGAGQGTAEEKLYYFPCTRQCAVPEEEETDEMTFSLTEKTGESGKYWESDKRYILSGIYAPKNVTAALLGISPLNEQILDKSYLSMQMNFNQGARPVSASLMLNTADELAELKPYHTYIFKIDVATTYIQIQLAIYGPSANTEWQSPSNNNSITMGDPDRVIDLGTVSINGWNETDLSQTIDNN